MSVTSPSFVDRLIVHQFDPARPSPGGIDTCLRGIARYAPEGQRIAVVGVDTGSGPRDRKIGKWEEHKFGENVLQFLPVVKVDPADQRRRIPHSLRLALGLMRYKSRLPQSAVVQAHRMDTAFLISYMLRRPRFVYYVHTQENGLTGKTSDSFWRKAAGIHAYLERKTVLRAGETVVFNKEYAGVLARWAPGVRFSPTWYDPRLNQVGTTARKNKSICWVGRLETPKDPHLALSVLHKLNEMDEGWTLDILGSGTLNSSLEQELGGQLRHLSDSIVLHGRVSPERTAEIMGESTVFLMTSHPGYEGYPRVLVEALASGLPAVVTEGSDTGGLVIEGDTGYVCGRDPEMIASRILDAQSLDRDSARASVVHLSATSVVEDIFMNGQRQ